MCVVRTAGLAGAATNGGEEGQLDPDAMTELPKLTAEDGQPFSADFLADARDHLNGLTNDERNAYRDTNASAIATLPDAQVLIVAGPGTGKSFLFMNRIRAWLESRPGRSIYVTSFVRKLVRDLENEIRTSNLSQDEKKLITTTTLHGLARSVIERNGGTSHHGLQAHIQMIGAAWQAMVWSDVRGLNPEVTGPAPFRHLERQFHDREMDQEEPWPTLRATYFELSRFYNAVGFADSIVLAAVAVEENPDLVRQRLWIIDEFQDFNTAEDELIQICTSAAQGVLCAGDDDQALYEELKASHPEIIRSYYQNLAWTKAMLPFCGRCTQHIAMAAEAYISAKRSQDSIEKIYLPLLVDGSATPVQAVCCSGASTAVDYIEQFVAEHTPELEERRDAIKNGTAKDSFLLLLSYSKDVRAYYKTQADRLRSIVEEWRLEEAGQGGDYYRLLTYYRSAQTPADNLMLRKVLHLQQAAQPDVLAIVSEALSRDIALSEVEHPAIALALESCREVGSIIDDAESTLDIKVELLGQVMTIDDPGRLREDLDTAPVSGDGSIPDEEDEDVETASRVSPVEMMSMVGAKGLSADHVMVLGFDNINMSKATPMVFFVAMTRARYSLHLITAFGARGAERPHPFLKAIPEEHCQHRKVLKHGVQDFHSRSEFDGYVKKVAWGRKHGTQKR